MLLNVFLDSHAGAMLCYAKLSYAKLTSGARKKSLHTQVMKRFFKKSLEKIESFRGKNTNLKVVVGVTCLSNFFC